MRESAVPGHPIRGLDSVKNRPQCHKPRNHSPLGVLSEARYLGCYPGGGSPFHLRVLRRAGDGWYNSCDGGQVRCIQNRGTFAAAPDWRATDLQEFAIIPLVSEEK